MSLDRRLKGAFHRAAASVDPSVDVERRLERTFEAARGRRQEFPLGGLLVASVVVLVVVVGASLLVPSPDHVGGPTPPGRGAVAGTYSVTLIESDPGVAELDEPVAGQWSMTLHETGTIDIVPPASFRGSQAAGHNFSVDGESFRTDLYYNDYCDGVGTYDWARTRSSLVLALVEDSCPLRRLLLATRPWVVEE